MKWPISFKFPRVFGWDGLVFADRLKALAFIFQVGGGVIMTAMSGYALWTLANLNAVWPVFYLGAVALLLVGIVLTGFGALLYRRSVDLQVGPLRFRTNDQESVPAVIAQATEIANVQRANEQDIRRHDASVAASTGGDVAGKQVGGAGA